MTALFYHFHFFIHGKCSFKEAQSHVTPPRQVTHPWSGWATVVNLGKRPTGCTGLLRWKFRSDYTRYDSSNGFIVKGSELGTLHSFFGKIPLGTIAKTEIEI